MILMMGNTAYMHSKTPTAESAADRTFLAVGGTSRDLPIEPGITSPDMVGANCQSTIAIMTVITSEPNIWATTHRSEVLATPTPSCIRDVGVAVATAHGK
jgi:hypothetical protein